MKTMFKPLGLAAAVAAVTAGYSGVAGAQERAVGNLGDLAIVPYYTVQGDWVTGVHIINTSDRTQVVKLRLRRGSDSADAMDFNLIMSPYDEWTGFLADEGEDIVWTTTDNTCAAKFEESGRYVMPDIFRDGAEEGYIEVIGMGAPIDEDQPIAVAAKHDEEGVPFSCASIETSFESAGSFADPGVASSSTSYQGVLDVEDYDSPGYDVSDTANCTGDEGSQICLNTFKDGGDALKVSYFFRDSQAGTEMGGNAVHIAGFSPDEPWISNQKTGLLSGDTNGFDYPDLNGGVLGYGDTRGLFNALRDPALLGVASVINDWSVNAALNVSTDWVVTLPGQYTMVDYVVAANFGIGNCGRLNDPTTAIDDGIPLCDFRDLPVTATARVTDREEGELVVDDGGLVISPAPPGQASSVRFENEVNIIEWGGDSSEPVLGSEYVVSGIDPLGNFGWASLSVQPTTKRFTGGTAGLDVSATGQGVCEYVPVPTDAAIRWPLTGSATGTWANPSSAMRTDFPFAPTTANSRVCEAATGRVPMIGFVAWQRSFPSVPGSNYGRLIEHSFSSN